MTKTVRDGTTTWRWQRRMGRLQMSLTVHRHSGHLPDRWVFQPDIVFDRVSRGVGDET